MTPVGGETVQYDRQYVVLFTRCRALRNITCGIKPLGSSYFFSVSPKRRFGLFLYIRLSGTGVLRCAADCFLSLFFCSFLFLLSQTSHVEKPV